MQKKQTSLLFKFGAIFLIFTIVTILMSSITTYVNQTNANHRDQEERIQQVAAYLDALIVDEGDEFAAYQEYLIAHREDLTVPVDFTEYQTAETRYKTLLAEKHPGVVPGKDIPYSELDPEVQEAFAIYMQEKWVLTFEQATESFHIAYSYYVVPTGEEQNMYFLIDAVRIEDEKDGEICLLLADEEPQDGENHTMMWEAWNTGERPQGYDSYDNEYGQTYGYYTPLIVNGEKLGVICVEVEIATVNRAILNNTLKEAAGIAAVLIASVIVMLLLINKHYIRKISNIQEGVQEFARSKDSGIAGQVEKNAVGNDEIAALATQTASMILEIDNYIKSLSDKQFELDATRVQALKANEMANKDALTGIRNRNAYEAEIKKLEWDMESKPDMEFGIAMVDLNFLKKINDTFGHDKGNAAIIKLCQLVCKTFDHSPVFRIGGDEFVVILKGDDFQNKHRLVQKFNDKLAEYADDPDLEYWEKISASIGIATYDPASDRNVDNVFKRADKAMYARKKEMKAVREE